MECLTNNRKIHLPPSHLYCGQFPVHDLKSELKSTISWGEVTCAESAEFSWKQESDKSLPQVRVEECCWLFERVKNVSSDLFRRMIFSFRLLERNLDIRSKDRQNKADNEENHNELSKEKQN